MKEYVLKIGNQYTSPYYDILIDGIGTCGNTQSEYENDEYRIISEEAFETFYNTHLDGLCGKWKEITQERYNDMLDALSPIKWQHGGFFMGEMYIADVGLFFQEWYGKYYESKQRTSYSRETIMSGLQTALKEGRV